MAVTVASLQAVLSLDKTGFDRGIKTSTGMLEKLGNVGVGMAVDALTGGLRAAGDAIASSVTASADLESQLSAVGAVTGATNDEIGELKSLVTDLGIDPNLKVSSFEAADAIEMLARNGLTVDEVLQGAARSTVLLANSTGSDFATAADIATDSMSIFGIEAGDMNKAVDGITSVVNTSKFSIDDYRLALAQAGGVAGATGVEFDDFNTAIAGIAPLFGSGSDAGTSFKVMLQRLIPQSKKADEAMADLGLMTFNAQAAMAKLEAHGITPVKDDSAALARQLSELFFTLRNDLNPETDKGQAAFAEWRKEIGATQSAFFDADGNLRGMADIAGELQSALGGLSEEQRNAALTTIFGTDAMRAAVGLMELGKDGFTDLQNTMAGTDATAAAAQRMDNLQGSLEILDGAVETVKIGIGDGLNPAVRSLAMLAANFVSENQAGMTGFFNDVGLGISDFITKAQAADSPVRELGMALNEGIIIPAGELLKALTGVNGGLSTTDTVLQSIAMVSDEMSPALNTFGSVLGILTGIVNISNTAFEALDKSLESIGLKVDSGKIAIQGMLDAALGLLVPITSLVNAFQTLNDAVTLFSGNWDRFKNVLEDEIGLPDWLVPGSPTPFETGLRGISDAINSMPELSRALPGGGNKGGTVYNNTYNLGGQSMTFNNQSQAAGIVQALQLLRQQLQAA